jgi:predicted ArsR family transcriptional regulator
MQKPKQKTSKRTTSATKQASVKAAKPASAKAADTKQQRLIELLKRPQGATIAQLAKALGWQKHTVRGTISGALKKRLGLTITSEKEDAGRVYRISAATGRVAT